ncbi:MAG: glycosyltransferase family 9 protein [Candidatus Coatesbacteria bacterium]|nr:glycosyltransferase family 9 protein [Candidatus Coatesbacteria bacterium]
MKKILIIRLKGFGDILMTSPVWRNIKLNDHSTEIHLLTDRKIAELSRMYKELDKVYEMDTSSLIKQIELISCLRKEKYDFVIDLFCNPRSSFLTLITNAPVRIGFNVRFRKHAYNKLISDEYRKKHEVMHHLASLAYIDMKIINDKIYLPDSIRKEFNLEIKDNSFFTVAPMGKWKCKRFPEKKMAEIINQIHDKFKLSSVVLYGDSEEKKRAEYIKSLTGNSCLLSPESDFMQMASIIEKSLFLLTNDTAALHIAEALEKPIIAFFGPTNPLTQGPRYSRHLIIKNAEMECLCCNKTVCKKNSCFENIDMNKAKNEIEIFINSISNPEA